MFVWAYGALAMSPTLRDDPKTKEDCFTHIIPSQYESPGEGVVVTNGRPRTWEIRHLNPIRLGKLAIMEVIRVEAKGRRKVLASTVG